MLQPVEVGRVHHHVGAGHDLQGAHGVVGAHGDVIGFGHAGDLAQLGDAPGPEHVRHEIVGQPLLQDGQEVEAGEEALAHADGRRHVLSDLPQGVDAFGGHRLLEPGDLRLLVEAVGQAYGRRHVVVAVGVDQDFHPFADGFPNRLHDVAAQFFPLG